jgi:hypothetical protein
MLVRRTSLKARFVNQRFPSLTLFEFWETRAGLGWRGFFFLSTACPAGSNQPPIARLIPDGKN